jgi:histidyl-tRNA synthetase
MVELMGATDLFDQIVIALDKLDKIGIDKVKEEMESKGVKKEALSILDTFLNIKNVGVLFSLLENSLIGKKFATLIYCTGQAIPTENFFINRS